MSSAVVLSQGLGTLDGTHTILQWITCGCETQLGQCRANSSQRRVQPRHTSGDKIFYINIFHEGWTGSPYAKIMTAAATTDRCPANSIKSQCYVLDSSTPTNINSGSILRDRRCAPRSPTPTPSGNGYYVVYTELQHGLAGYCGWMAQLRLLQWRYRRAVRLHLQPGRISGCQLRCLERAVEPWLVDDAGVSAHELSEAITDPAICSWFDSSRQEKR